MFIGRKTYSYWRRIVLQIVQMHCILVQGNTLCLDGTQCVLRLMCTSRLGLVQFCLSKHYFGLEFSQISLVFLLCYPKLCHGFLDFLIGPLHFEHICQIIENNEWNYNFLGLITVDIEFALNIFVLIIKIKGNKNIWYFL